MINGRYKEYQHNVIKEDKIKDEINKTIKNLSILHEQLDEVRVKREVILKEVMKIIPESEKY